MEVFSSSKSLLSCDFGTHLDAPESGLSGWTDWALPPESAPQSDVAELFLDVRFSTTVDNLRLGTGGWAYA